MSAQSTLAGGDIVTIRDIAYYLPETVVDNAMLAREHPAWDVERVAQRVGVARRHIARSDETALDLAVAACERLLARHEDWQTQIDGIIFCTQTPDYVLPPNACVLHQRLRLTDQVFAVDITHGCSGFLYALALAKGLLATGQCRNILIVTADTYSKYIHPDDRSVRMLFSDGAAVTWVTGDNAGVCDIRCGTAGAGHERFIVPAGGCRTPKSAATVLVQQDASGNARSLEHIRMDGLGVQAFVHEKIPAHILALLKDHQLTMADIAMVFFHQASQLVLESLTHRLQIDPTKVFSNLREVGNTVSASIPIALKDAMEAERLQRGDTILLSGFGVGLSWGTALLTW